MWERWVLSNQQNRSSVVLARLWGYGPVLPPVVLVTLHTHFTPQNRTKRGYFQATARSLLFLVNDWTNNPSLRAMPSGGCGYPWGCSLISIPSQKSPIFAQQLEEETEEQLGSRILVGYDNAHEDRTGLWRGGQWRGGRLRDGWIDRGRERGWCTKEGGGGRGRVVVSADGWVGGLFCHI